MAFKSTSTKLKSSKIWIDGKCYDIKPYVPLNKTLNLEEASTTKNDDEPPLKQAKCEEDEEEQVHTEYTQNTEETKPSSSSDHGRTVWSYEATIALINSMSKHYKDLCNVKKRRYVFKTIARELLNDNHVVTSEMCHSKWKSLLRSYKSNKDTINKSGQPRFFFFNEMNDILGNLPSVSSTHVLESSSLSNFEIEREPETEELEFGYESEMEVCEDGKIRGRNNLCHLKRLEYARRQKRHEERMLIEHRKIELLEQLLEKY